MHRHGREVQVRSHAGSASKAQIDLGAAQCLGEKRADIPTIETARTGHLVDLFQRVPLLRDSSALNFCAETGNVYLSIAGANRRLTRR
jgi:hypothetical protein